MFQKFISTFFSMRIMAFLVLLFFIAIGYATFIENDFGTQTAKALVYNATWFEILIIVLTVNMIGNINRYQLWKKEKLPVLMFHLAFVMIAIGAGITRYVSFEGMMHIREGDRSNQIVSDQTFLQIKVHDRQLQYVCTINHYYYIITMVPFHFLNQIIFLMILNLEIMKFSLILLITYLTLKTLYM